VCVCARACACVCVRVYVCVCVPFKDNYKAKRTTVEREKTLFFLVCGGRQPLQSHTALCRVLCSVQCVTLQCVTVV